MTKKEPPKAPPPKAAKVTSVAISSDLHKRAKIQATIEGVTLLHFVEQAIKAKLKEETS